MWQADRLGWESRGLGEREEGMKRQPEGRMSEMHFLKVIPALSKAKVLSNNCVSLNVDQKVWDCRGCGHLSQEEDTHGPRAEEPTPRLTPQCRETIENGAPRGRPGKSAVIQGAGQVQRLPLAQVRQIAEET